MGQSVDTAGPISPSGALDSRAVTVEVDYSRLVSYAMQQNDVPVVHRVRVTNVSDAALSDVIVRLQIVGDLSLVWEAQISRIDPGQTASLEKVELRPRSDRLVNQNERESTLLRLEVLTAGVCVLRAFHPVTVLAYSEWGGEAGLREILAAFVLPNHPAIAGVLLKAREHLAGATGNPSLAGYQLGQRGRARDGLRAIYEALRASGITYINPPASFESAGQKIRTPEQIAGGGMGTCLDLAALVAACAEQAGLHPLIVFVKGHAFAGVWTIEDSFPEAIVEDAARLRKRADLGELCFVECTTLCGGQEASFESALREGRRRLESDPEFRFAVDLHAARRSGIRPLPVRVGVGGFLPVESPVAAHGLGAGEAPAPSAAGRDPLDSPPPAAAEADVRTRIDTWKRKLLDLGLRNRLVNFTDTKKSLKILCPDVGALEDALANDKEFRVLARPRLGQPGADPRDLERLRSRTGEEAMAPYLRTELDAGRLHADADEATLDARLIDIYRAANLSLQEGGANTLFLALGFLAWYETPASEQRRLAPILLLPLEIRRASVAEGFRIRLADDDPLLNETLLQKIEKDFGVKVEGLRGLAADESGIDIPDLFRRFREAIKDVPRWDVVGDAHLGLFSFSKFLMWKDLESLGGKLQEGSVISHLVKKPGTAFEPGAVFPDERELDEKRRPHETWCPLDADSSQLAAVFAAADGRTFVLEGPPGTGKSQTIANVIAQALALGKSVLFVSEKMVALEVVHRRLKKVGLDPFCLELHSNKARKTDIVAHLAATLRAGGVRAPSEWEGLAQRLLIQRRDLNAYAAALHSQRRYGGTYFQALGELLRLSEVLLVPHRFGEPDSVDASRLADLRDLATNLQTSAASIQVVPSASPYRAIGLSTWDPGLSGQAAAAVETLERLCGRLEAAAVACAPSLGFSAESASRSTFDLMGQAGGCVLSALATPAALATEAEFPVRKAKIGTLIATGRARDAGRSDLDARWSRGFLDVAHRALATDYREWKDSLALVRWWKLRKANRLLRSLSKSSQVGSISSLIEDLEAAKAVVERTALLQGAGPDASRWLGALWHEGEGDWKGIEAALPWAESLRALAARAAGSAPERAAALTAKWAELAALVAEGGAPSREPLQELRAALSAHRDAEKALEALLRLDSAVAWGDPGQAGYLARGQEAVSRWPLSPGELRNWCAYVRARDAARESGLGPLAAAHAEGRLSTDLVPKALDRAFFEWWISAVTSQEESLRTFHGDEHGNRVRRFQELDREAIRGASDIVRARLSARIPPSSGPRVEGTERGILLREAEKRGRHLPVRQLFAKIGNMLPRLAPCLLMSPLSVAQYLSVDAPPFDLVVFDEASQIPTWDAAGALARGRQAIVVGDSKQLPPTNFFQRVDAEDDLDETEYQDLESVLDECRAAGLPPLDLKWHYRSRHESLIAFSNRRYYERRLLTFPSPHADVEDLGVRWRHVRDGVYDRGGTKTNPKEAEAVVREVVERLSDPERRLRSIGIVTINLQQQELIEDLIERARKQHPEIEKWLGEDLPEPHFVKNLENVQGDERDVILFSLGYGRDREGRMTMNFGALNRQGGERRLNVAVTRARQELVMFASIEASDIDLSRTTNVGVKHLREFLDYAARGTRALDEVVDLDATRTYESPFEMEVGRALEARGHTVHKQVGCSGYRVDLAVVDPDNPGRYLLGIECDGANYHSGKTARDRDRLRESVLTDLGWTLHRIWSSDWWIDRPREIEKVEKALARARAAGPRRGASGGANAAVDAPSAAPARAAAAFASLGAGIASAASAGPADLRPRAEAPALSSAGAAGSSAYPGPGLIPQHGSPAAFYDPRTDRRILQLLREVVERESPIVFGLAARRVKEAFGLGQLNDRVLDRIMALLRQSSRPTLVPLGLNGVFWKDGQVPARWREFRVPSGSEETRRDADEIPMVEIANAAEAVIQREVSMLTEALAREVARVFGIRRMGDVVRRSMEAGILALAARGGCVLEGDTVRIPR